MTSAKLRQLADDASPTMRANIERALGGGIAAITKPVESQSKPGIRLPKARKMTVAEQEYGAVLRRAFPSGIVRFEAITFRLASGARYTPDWTVWFGAKMELVIEVKGGYRLGSAGRSHLAFKCAIVEFPEIQFRYVEKDMESGQWKTIDANK